MEMQWYSKFNPYAATWTIGVFYNYLVLSADLGLILCQWVDRSDMHMHVTRVNE